MRYRTKTSASGFTLIEVLVSMFIIAIGLLGLAGIQSMIVSNSGTARIRSIAAILAENMSGAMGANESYWSTGAPPATLTVTGAVSASSCDATWSATTLSDGTLQGKNTDCTTGNCGDPTTMAAYDVKYWGCQLATQLPSGSGQIACTAASATSPTSCRITVQWAEKNTAYKQSSSVANNFTTQQYTMVTQP